MSSSPQPPTLSAVPSTLHIPLAARALGDRLFPDLAVEDRHAAKALSHMGDDGGQWLQDRQSIYGVLARTRCFRDLAQAFLKKTPAAQVANLGCGLSDYLQWLENDRLRMIDADLPEVMAIRRELLPARHKRHRLAELDLTSPDWWDALGLPAQPKGDPVFLMSEGVFMYLQPAIVKSVLATFGERAPAGSVLAFDVMCWLAIGRAKQHPLVRHTDAQFHWGPCTLADLTRPHKRLRLQAAHPIMENYSWFYQWLEPWFLAVAGVPLYAVYALRTT